MRLIYDAPVPDRTNLLRVVVSLAPAAALVVALSAWAAPGPGGATGKPPASAPATAAATAAAAPAGTAASRPASIPVPMLPGTDPKLMPDALPAPSGAAASAPAAPRYEEKPGTAEPKRLSGHGPSTIIIPVQTLPLNMNHKFHLTFLACADCHVKAPGSKTPADSLIPDEAVCTDCHDIDRADFEKDATPGAACAFCHRGFDPKAAAPAVWRVSLPAPHLKFPHDKHIAKGFACERCHAGVKDTTFADRDRLPRMALCLECHNGRIAPDACTTCHLTEKDGKLKVEWPEGLLTPSDSLRGMAHTPDWEMSHGPIAATDGATCMACHREEECGVCHEGIARPTTIHVGDYALKHAVDARRGDPDCTACHRLQTFCLTCHTRMGVSLASASFTGGRTPTMPFHPPGWNAPSEGAAPVHHSAEARKNITACAACHREKDCTRCHADLALRCRGSPDDAAFCSKGTPPGFGGPGGLFDAVTHPAGFAKVCGRFMKRNVSACLRCHTTTFLATSCAD